MSNTHPHLVRLAALLASPSRMKTLATAYASQKAGTIAAALDFARLQSRRLHPAGEFDNAKRWWPESDLPCCDGIRHPSRAHPFSLLVHARSAEHVALEHKLGAGASVEVKSLGQALAKAELDSVLPAGVTDADLVQVLGDALEAAWDKLLSAKVSWESSSSEHRAAATNARAVRAKAAMTEAIATAGAAADAAGVLPSAAPRRSLGI